MAAYNTGIYSYTGGAEGGVPMAGNESTSSSVRSMSAKKSGVVNTFRKKRSRLEAEMDPEAGLKGKPGLTEGYGGVRSKYGTYNPMMGREGAHKRFEADIARSKWTVPQANRARRLKSMSSSRHFLDRATGPTKGKSSRDSSKESYSTMETRAGKSLVNNPGSAFRALGSEQVRSNLTQMFRADTKNKGAVRRSMRSFL